LRDAPDEIGIAIQVHAVTRRPGVVAPVLAPHVVDRHHVVAPVRVDAGQQPDVHGLEDQFDFIGCERLAAIADVGSVRIAQQQVDGKLDDGVRIHQLARVRATHDEHAAAPCAASRAHAQRVDRATLDRRLGELEAGENLRKPG
jgi:hypothetical protein